MMNMKPTQILKHWPTQLEAAKAIGVSQPTISYWKTSGSIPPLQQLRIQTVTLGALKADDTVRI